MIPLALGLVLLILAVWLLLRKMRPRGGPPAAAPADELALQARPLLGRTEATLYNLLRLAVRDRYLVLAQVPLWCLAEVKAAEPERRRAFLRAIAFKRLDFALVHPGTLAVEKVIELEGLEPASALRQGRAKLLDQICREIGVEVVRLDATTGYTAATLAARLGVEPEE